MATSTSETSEMLSSERLQQQSPAAPTRTCQKAITGDVMGFLEETTAVATLVLNTTINYD